MSKKASDFQVGDAQVWVGDSLDRLSILPNESVQACVTSPPYFGLRDYGVKGQIGLEASPAEYIDRLVAFYWRPAFFTGSMENKSPESR